MRKTLFAAALLAMGSIPVTTAGSANADPASCVKAALAAGPDWTAYAKCFHDIDPGPGDPRQQAPVPAGGPNTGGPNNCHYTWQFAYLNAQCCRDAVMAGQTPC
jgi:hypothetical protein